MHESKGVLTPMTSTLSLSLNDGTLPVDAIEYRKIIGKPQYLSFTEPNISFFAPYYCLLASSKKATALPKANYVIWPQNYSLVFLCFVHVL